jgi:hypothetical protein
MKRSGKFYRKNEEEVMRSLGLEPTFNSGSSWIQKEDGESEEVLCQLKSTDANSIKINKPDIDTLLYNSQVSHKLPVFAIQFLKSHDTYLLVRPDDLVDLAKYIKTGEYESKESFLELQDVKDTKVKKKKKVVSSSSDAREKYNEEYDERFKKKSKSANIKL